MTMFWADIIECAELGLGIALIIFVYRIAWRRWSKKLAARRANKVG